MRRVIAVAGVVVLLLVGLAAPAVGGHARELVFTDRGPVRGAVYGETRVFQRIPYAAPPVGELRWREPQPAAAWREPLDATVPPSVCPQGPIFGYPSSDTEDCLHLNVSTPARRHGERLPVMVWIHGGTFAFGSGGIYDGRALAADGDVVVVTMNYRLGALGLLALPELSAEGVQSGNYGFLDQQAALRWVQRNIAAFGGDPRNVTVFGESVGGMSMCAHLVSPASRGLFHRGIGQSWACTAPLATAEESELTGAAFAAQVGCVEPGQVVACLREKSAAAVVEGWVPGGSPVVGGRDIPVQPADALRTGAYRHMPMLLGNNLDEMRFTVKLMYDAAGQPVTSAQYEEIIRATYGPGADEVLRRYPATDYSTPSVALATVQTHDTGAATSTCDQLGSYRAFARGVPVYAYQFADRTAPVLLDVPGFDEGAEHTVELNSLFPNVFGAPLTPAQQALSSTMVRYWTNFARYGNPNGPGVPPWPRFRDADDVLSLDIGRNGVRPVDIATASNCDFWAALPR